MQSKLYALRKDNGITQEEMANKLGISRGRYSMKERGNAEFTQDEMFEISKMFKRNIDDIFLPRTYQIGTK
ncbi:helix-turn-helix transcriptional regulator [Limosilactobacillus fermentum]|nr:helix-turn-helix domain-containing protein [Lactobacillus sp.]